MRKSIFLITGALMALFFAPQAFAAYGIDQYTKLMIHSNTFHGDTVFTDSSFEGHAISGHDDVKHSITPAKFGSSSIYFDGSGDFLTVPDDSDFVFGTGDFTIDFWVYRNPPTSNECWFGATGNGNDNGWLLQYYIPADSLSIWLGDGSHVTFSTIGLTTDTWHHLAAVRSSGDIYLFLNGSQVGSALPLPHNQSANDYGLYIGKQPHPSAVMYFDGNIDEYRISKGVARWCYLQRYGQRRQGGIYRVFRPMI